MKLKPIDAILYLSIRLLKLFDRRKHDTADFNPAKVKRILVVSSTAIGDTLLSTPAFHAVRNRFPAATITAHLNMKNMELFQNNPDIDGVIPYYGGYKKFFKTIREFRKNKFDLVFIFHGNEPQATPMAYLSGADFIFKLPNTSEYRFLLSNKYPVLGIKDFSHAIEHRLMIAALAGCSTADNRMVLPISKKADSVADVFLSEHNIQEADFIIGFQVGASTLSRMWFADRFVELGKKLIESYPDLSIVITGSDEEYSYCKKTADSIGNKALVSAGQIQLKYLPALVKRFKALVTGDTGTMHIAIAVGTPVISLFAVADPATSGPYYDLSRHSIISKGRTCDPCAGKKCEYQKCMENISVDEVFEAVKKILQNK